MNPLKRLIPFFWNNFSEVKIRSLLLFYTLLAVLIRLPFFFRDYIDRDESTFIIMGQSWVDGNLPYTELWDLKPPLVFLFFAGIIYVFGKSFIAIRLIGTLTIVATSFLLYKLGWKLHSKKAGFWIGLLYIFFSSLFGNVQGVMSEHLSMFFFIFALVQLFKANTHLQLLGTGFLFGCALLMKLNLSYAFVLILLAFFYLSSKREAFKFGFLKSTILGVGALLAFLFSFLPYYFKGLSQMYIDSVFLAALTYSDVPLKHGLAMIMPLIVILGFVLGFILWNNKKKHLHKGHLLYIAAAILGVCVSFFKLGKLNSHYLIQLYPFLIILLIIFILSFKEVKNKSLKYLLIPLFILLPIESYIEYSALAKNLLKNESLYYREGFKITNYLKTTLKNNEQVLFLDFHIGGWLLDQKPLTKAVTHPSNINRANLFPFFGNKRNSSIEELSYILKDLKPVFIITKNGDFPSLDQKDLINAFFQSYLKDHYQLDTIIGTGLVFRLKP